MKTKKPIPFDFVLAALERAQPYTRPMFGCTSVYVGDQIVMILREKDDATAHDNGVWIATTQEHHASLKRDFPSMRSIRIFSDGGPTGWQNLPAESDDFEESALKLCQLVLRKDPRVGKVPASRKKKLSGKGPAGKRTARKKPSAPRAAKRT